MENVSGLSGTGTQPELEAPAVETVTPQSQQSLPPLVLKKRKGVETTRSLVWDHFEKIKDSEGITIKGKCIYCAKVYACETKKHVTSSLRNHIVSCLKNPHSKETRQSMLTFQPAPSSAGTQSSEGIEGVLEWKLQKKIISFVPIYSHKGENIAKALESCLLYWGLKSVFSVTLDNASSNDTALGFLKKKLVSWGCTTVRCKYLHMRCIVHILNLVAQDGLKECDSSVKKVRDAIRYVRSSPARLQKFRDLADLIWVEAKNSLCLNVPTRWNSTYMTLNTALLFQKVFEAYEDHDSSFKSDLGGSVPDFMDWESIQSLVKILKSFYEMIVRISGSLYVTSNTFFYEVSDLSCLLKNMEEATEDSVKVMGKNMRAKFDKYWGELEKMNFLIFYANILDPRDKIEYMPIQFNQLYGEDKGKAMFDKVIVGLKELFQDYVACFPFQSVEQYDKSSPSITISDSVSGGRPQSLLKSQIKKQKLESGDLSRKKTELEVYLSEVIVDDEDSFDLLRWWKQQSESTSRRVLDAFRSSLTPRIIEALVCAHDWLRLANQPIYVEENIDDVERIEKELCSTSSTGVGSSLPTILVLYHVCASMIQINVPHEVGNWKTGKCSWLGNILNVAAIKLRYQYKYSL
ncbi:PREDICTED: zinc finger BED domain-containing protein RICESLEEPER 2-like [Ipomoea nil]|uniref:zinc finger BED domain-containing protein RICESLEEPER 2-like n=1 Tax=Ipomoea nil TaxID=35883 RepID=UPI000901FEE8|nr:PREDICTED: zinc finger BED domain-containing protein RICESLEEPER 2-like [Ipomoea nil]